MRPILRHTVAFPCAHGSSGEPWAKRGLPRVAPQRAALRRLIDPTADPRPTLNRCAVGEFCPPWGRATPGLARRAPPFVRVAVTVPTIGRRCLT